MGGLFYSTTCVWFKLHTRQPIIHYYVTLISAFLNLPTDHNKPLLSYVAVLCF